MRILRFGFALAAGMLPSAAFGQSTDTPELLAGESVVRVEAEGSVERAPDFISLGVTIRSDGKSPAEAAEANSAKLARLMRDLDALGVDEGRISADELAAQPVYAETDGREDRSRILGYRTSQTITIELRDLNRLYPVITRLVQDGYGDLRANFELRDPAAARAEAQRAAIANAVAEAENIASALGKRLGRLLLVGNSQHAYQGWTRPYDIIVSGSRMQPLVLQPAPIEIESKVYADWSLVDR